MLLIIGALFITQFYWFKKTFDLEERQFDEKVNIALRNVADHLLKIEKDSTSKILPITKIASNEYYVRTNCYFKLTDLDSSIRSNFIERAIKAEFDYIVVNSKLDKIEFGNSLSSLFITDDISCSKRDFNKKRLDFKIRINNKTTYLIQSMGIWMFSSISLLAILAVFMFIMVSIIKGKRLALLKNDFVNNMTHELKTPIANIAVASNAIRKGNVNLNDVKLKNYADIIYKENTRLHSLVDRVLQISAMEKKDESLFIETIDLHKIIRNTAESFEPVIHQKNGNIILNLNANRYKLQADKTHISNVIYNLIENAIKYSKNQPEITIVTHDNNTGVNIEINDKGIGINKINQEKIFEKFFRGQSGNLHNTKGYGLGLAYVKLIVEKHKGLITFKSKENIGSSFNVYLPI